MVWCNTSVLAVVPARGGSKGIPRKNLQRLSGRSLVAHVADVVKQLPWIDRAILSTDDAEIAAEGRRTGLAVPFVRPAELSQDNSRSVDVWRHAWLELESHDARRYDISVLLEPTSPMRRAADVERTLNALISGDYAAAVTVSETPAHYTPHKTLTLADGIVGFYLSDGARYARRQDIPPYYHRNGACYAAHRATVVDRRQILEDRCIGVVLERPMVNIDDQLDLAFAEFLLARGY